MDRSNIPIKTISYETLCALCVQSETAPGWKSVYFRAIFPQFWTILLSAISAQEPNAKPNNQSERNSLDAKQSYCRPYAEDFFEAGTHTYGFNSYDQAPTLSIAQRYIWEMRGRDPPVIHLHRDENRRKIEFDDV